MATTGALNGTGVFVAMDLAVPGSVYEMVGGQNSHALTLNNAIIDITNKSSASFRELLGGEGIQSLDLSLELTFNSEATFASLKTIAGSKAQASFQIDVNGDLIQFVGQVASFAQSAPDGDKLSATVSIQSSGTFIFV